MFVLFSISVRFYSSIYFIRFSMNISLNLSVLVGSSGLEPPTSRLSGVRSNHLSYEPISYSVYLVLSRLWWRWWDSNPWPPACRAGALPTELHPHFRLGSTPLGVNVGLDLSSRAVASQVFSALRSLTSVFGMGTGGPSAFVRPTFTLLLGLWKLNSNLSRLESVSQIQSCVAWPRLHSP